MRSWTVTAWRAEAPGRWDGVPPYILIEGESPFTADTPLAMAAKLLQMAADPTLERGPIYAYLGQFLDQAEIWESLPSWHLSLA